MRAVPVNGHMTLEFPLEVVPNIRVRAGATEVFDQHCRVWERACDRFDEWSLGRLLDLRAVPVNGYTTLEFPLCLSLIHI